jgi:hypothetical protein
MRRWVVFISSWLVVLALAQVSLNPTIGLLAVVACAIHLGLMLGRPRTGGLALGFALWLARLAASWLVRRPVGALGRLLARLVPRRTRRSQADTIGIQVHLADRGRAAAIERRLRATLGQCAQTWAPHPLPVDRIAVYAGAPPAGKAQVYAEWQPANAAGQPRSASLTVIALGLLDATGRPLDDQHLAGALATQVAALVADRYDRQRTQATAASGPAPTTTASSATSPARPGRQPATDLVDPVAAPDQDVDALMKRLRHQASPLEPEPGSPPHRERALIVRLMRRGWHDANPGPFPEHQEEQHAGHHHFHPCH